MDSYPGFESTDTTSDKVDEKTKEKKAKKLGAFSQFSLTRETSVKEKDDKKSSWRDTASEKADKPVEYDKTDDAAQEKLKTPDSTEIREAKRQILLDQTAEKIAALKEEVQDATPDTPEHAVAVAALNAEESLHAKATDPLIEADPAIEEEYDRRMAKIDPEDLAEAIITEEVNNELALEDPSDEATEAIVQGDEPIEGSDSVSENTVEPTVVIPAPLPVHPSVASGGRMGTNPPLPPQFRFESGDTPGLPPTNHSGEQDTSPNAIRFNQQNESTDDSVDETRRRTNKAGAFLAGGALGYMVGRRGGRKRTEAKLQPRINTLEKEAEQTKRHLETRESELKKAILERESARTASSLERPGGSDSSPVTSETTIKPIDAENNKDLSPQTTMETSRDSSPVLSNTETADKIESVSNGETPPLEKTIHLQKERLQTDEIDIFERNQPEQSKEKTEKNTITSQDVRRVEQLSTPEILKHAEMLYINGINVKDMYNANRIDRAGLITIVQESMRGRDIKAAFEKVELGAERQRERAREFRHDDPGFISTSTATPSIVQPLGHTVIQDVKANTSAPTSSSNQNFAPPDVSNMQPLNIPSADQPTPHDPKTQLPTPQRSIAFSVIAALVVAAIVLATLFLLF